MAEPLPDWLQKLLRDVPFTDQERKDAAWQLSRGGNRTWILKHWAVERLGAHLGIETICAEVNVNEIDCPIASSKNAEVVRMTSISCLVRGHMKNERGDILRSDWSIGEASWVNTGQVYQFSMAEKRAKDRVILKLAGVHGLLYSEEEAEEFKQ